MIPLSLELSGHVDSDGEEGVSVEKQETHGGTIRLLVSLPKQCHADHTNLAAALLFEQIDQLPMAARVERVKFSGLRFSPAGVHGIKEFLSFHAPSVKIVSLKDIVRKNAAPEDEDVFSALAEIFQESKLEVLNLSDNTIGAYMWKHWSNQTELRHLLLDHVDMDDGSIKELACQLSCAETLEDIYAVLETPAGEISVTDTSSLLGSCKRLTSLRWAHETANSESKLPWFGLQQMVRSQLEVEGVVSLRHLVMDGSVITASELGNDGLYGALREMSQLKTLKLREVALKDEGVKSVVDALELSQPPLEWLDLSGNQIKGDGAKTIAKLVNVDSIISNIKMLVLEGNEIDTEGGIDIIASFAPKVLVDFDTLLDGNPMDFSKLIMSMAWTKAQAEKERDELRRDQQEADLQFNELQRNLETLASENSSMSADLQLLQAAYEKQKKENDILVEAFSILGLQTQIGEQKRLLDRVSKVEDVMGLNTPTERSLPDQDHQNQKLSSSSPRRDVRGGYDSPTSATLPDDLSTQSSRASNPA